MAKLWLDWSDGRYWTRLLTDEEAAAHTAKDLDVVHLEDNVYEAYLRHCDRDATWQVHWRAVSNEQAMRRREKELLPLEEADREIRRLKEDLARAQRMAKYFEDEYTRQRHEHHRADYIEYTCIYPQPDCTVDVLRPEWRDRAIEILEHYNPVLAAEGTTRQGCCCGHSHRKLDEASAQQLRDCGFIVEHDAEST